MSFKSKNAVVVGGAGGIGLSICKKLLEDGISNLAIIDLKDGEPEICKKYRNEFKLSAITYLRTDISIKNELEQSFKRIMDKFGQIDILINTSGILDDTNIKRTMEVNVVGVLMSSLIAMNYMSKSQNGHGGLIVNMSSVLGLDPLFILPVYTASKHAIVGFTRSMGHEYYYKRTGVKFLTICPGGTITTFLDNVGEKMVIPDEDTALKFLHSAPKQSTEDLADHIMRTMISGENGSVWICDNNIMKNIKPFTYWEF